MNYHFFQYLQTLARHISLFLLVLYLTSSYLMLLLYLTSYLSIKYDLILNAITVKAKSPSENGCLNASLGRIKFCRSSSSYFSPSKSNFKIFFFKILKKLFDGFSVAAAATTYNWIDFFQPIFFWKRKTIQDCLCTLDASLHMGYFFELK